jgi:hypothetical protein
MHRCDRGSLTCDALPWCMQGAVAAEVERALGDAFATFSSYQGAIMAAIQGGEERGPGTGNGSQAPSKRGEWFLICLWQRWC